MTVNNRGAYGWDFTVYWKDSIQTDTADYGSFQSVAILRACCEPYPVYKNMRWRAAFWRETQPSCRRLLSTYVICVLAGDD